MPLHGIQHAKQLKTYKTKNKKKTIKIIKKNKTKKR